LLNLDLKGSLFRSFLFQAKAMEAGQPKQVPTVSVIIPAYNTAGLIAECIDSVLAQTYRGFEIIVINDGSPDTELLERALAPHQQQIRYLRRENGGPSGGRNLGILQAAGNYIAFLDSDDEWFPQHLSEHMSMLEQDPSLDLVYADYVLVRDGRRVGHGFGLEPQHPPVSFEKILTEECTVGTSSTVAKRQALIDAGLFDERFRCCEDFDLWLRMSFRGAKIGYHRGLHMLHRLAPESLSGNRYTMKRARIEVYRKTASLPLSAAQRALIDSLIQKNEAECQTDLVKQHLHEREYSKALQAAKLASQTKRNWKMRATVLGLQKLPAVFRCCHAAYERSLAILHSIRRIWSAPKLQSAVLAARIDSGDQSYRRLGA
jgi:glycosyltransferase involved in cell wall biosynthesis